MKFKYVSVSTLAERVRMSKYHGGYQRFHPRWYGASSVMKDEAAAATVKEAAADYNAKRSIYKKQVSALRKAYASEVALQKADDESERAAQQKEMKRKKLETQRLKNIRSAQNAKRQLELQEMRRLEWEQELQQAQIKREARNKTFQKARQLLVDELEQEAPLWLTTPQEVEAALTPEASQQLWTFPNSVIGAPAPTEDAEFWQYESHTWHMDKTYQTRREFLLEELVEQSYSEANIDNAYWTAERLQQRKNLEDKAKLRAMVVDAGKRSLLLKQKQLLQETRPEDTNIPSAMPVPNVEILSNKEAMEKEGVSVLLNNPTKFFEFDTAVTGNLLEGDGKQDYEGPTLGAPVALKDPIRTANTFYRPFPEPLGRLPEADTRSEKEKKREKREQAMIAAAKGEQDMDIEDFEEDEVPDIDFNNVKYESDEEWAEGLDPVADKDILDVPKRYRYNDDDVDWVLQSLEKRIGDIDDEIKFQIELARQELRGKAANITDQQQVDPAEGATDPSQYVYEGTDKTYDLDALGINTDDVHSVMSSLTEEQMLSLYALDQTKVENEPMSSDELRAQLAKIGGLTEKQIDSIVALEESLAGNEMLASERKLDILDLNK